MKKQTYGIAKVNVAYFSFLSNKHRKAAVKNYRDNRENGEAIDAPPYPFPNDGEYWDPPENRKLKNIGFVHIKYTEGLGDRKWMEKKDQNYQARLKRQEEQRIKTKIQQDRLVAIQEKRKKSKKQALQKYRKTYEIGETKDSPLREFPKDGSFTNVEEGWNMVYEPGPLDSQWMQERRKNFNARLRHKKQLEKYKLIQKKIFLKKAYQNYLLKACRPQR